MTAASRIDIQGVTKVYGPVRAVRDVEAPFPTLSTSPAAGLLDTQEAIASRLTLALTLLPSR